MTPLTERYVHATTRSLPEARRGEIGRELAASIDEMVAARTDNGEAFETAERAVLVELGHPDRLAAQYADRPQQLIGPNWYPVWWRLLKNLVIWIPVPLGVLVAVIKWIELDVAGPAVREGVMTAMMTALQIAFWVTLVFALIDRYGSEKDLPAWDVDSLPEVPREQPVSLGDTIASVVTIVVVAGLLVLQHFRSWVPGDGGDHLAVLDPDLWSGWLPAFLVVLVLCIGIEIWKYRVGRFTWPIVGAIAATSLASAAILVYLCAADLLLNPAFVAKVGMSADHVETANLVVAASAVVIELWTIADAVVKARRDSAGSTALETVR